MRSSTSMHGPTERTEEWELGKVVSVSRAGGDITKFHKVGSNYVESAPPERLLIHASMVDGAALEKAYTSRPDWPMGFDTRAQITEFVRSFLIHKNPLKRGRSRRVIGENIRTLQREHVPHAQALAIALRTAGVRRRNPATLDSAAKLLEQFSGHMPGEVLKVKQAPIKKGLVIGTLDGVPYTTVRDGKTLHYLHEFKEHARPLLIASSDGRRLGIVGGRFQFTAAGIVDDDT